MTSREGELGDWNRTVETHSNRTHQYIDSLNPYTVYLFRVAAENALGYSRPGKESYPTLTLRESKLLSMKLLILLSTVATKEIAKNSRVTDFLYAAYFAGHTVFFCNSIYAVF